MFDGAIDWRAIGIQKRAGAACDAMNAERKLDQVAKLLGIKARLFGEDLDAADFGERADGVEQPLSKPPR